MGKTFLQTLATAGACSIISLAIPLYAQQPGGAPGGGAPMSQPGQAPGSPGMNTPTATDQTDTMSTPAKTDDKKFVKEAAEGNMAEIQVGKLAMEKSSSPAVKQFAQKLIADHTEAGDKLKQVASKENMPVPAALASKQQSKIDKLSKLSGPAFDKAFVKDAVKDHKSDIKMFQSEAQNGGNPAVKQFASETLPTLKQHLAIAKGLNKSDAGMMSSGTN